MTENTIARLFESCGLGEVVPPVLPVQGGFMHRMFRVSTGDRTYAVKHLNPEIMKRPDVMKNYRRAEELEQITAEAPAASDKEEAQEAASEELLAVQDNQKLDAAYTLALNANSWSRAAAAGGIRLLLPPLQALAGGGLPGPEQREALYEGSILGGTAISVTGTLLPHNLGYYLTERYGIPHGFACAEFLPDLFALTKQRDPARWAEFEAQTGTSLPALTELIRTLCPKPKLRMDDEEIGAILPRWENSAALRKTPGSLGLAEIRTIWETHFGA